VGESGSGKSTIAKLITRQIDATTGTIEIDGQDITKLTGRQLIPVYAKIQMVFQTPTGSFDPRRTLGDGICESLRNKGVSKAEREAKARGLLEQCGLPGEFLERYPHQVSGGQCQRAAIARALMCDPRILIFDEATSALDVTVQKQIIELLQQLQKEKNLAYLFICHNLALVQQFCDKVIVLYDGKIVEHGLPDEVILHPQSDYAKRLVDAIF
jgi:peptide/nickel transport system ATP-binding protein